MTGINQIHRMHLNSFFMGGFGVIVIKIFIFKINFKGALIINFRILNILLTFKNKTKTKQKFIVLNLQKCKRKQ